MISDSNATRSCSSFTAVALLNVRSVVALWKMMVIIAIVVMMLICIVIVVVVVTVMVVLVK